MIARDESGMDLKRFSIVDIMGGVAVAAAIVVVITGQFQSSRVVTAAEKNLTGVTVDYPLDGSIFPPEITAPTFIWRDARRPPTSGESSSRFPMVRER